MSLEGEKLFHTRYPQDVNKICHKKVKTSLFISFLLKSVTFYVFVFRKFKKKDVTWKQWKPTVSVEFGNCISEVWNHYRKLFMDNCLMFLSPAVNNYTVAVTLVVGKERCVGRSVNYFIYHKAGQVKMYEMLILRHLRFVLCFWTEFHSFRIKETE